MTEDGVTQLRGLRPGYRRTVTEVQPTGSRLVPGSRRRGTSAGDPTSQRSRGRANQGQTTTYSGDSVDFRSEMAVGRVGIEPTTQGL